MSICAPDPVAGLDQLRRQPGVKCSLIKSSISFGVHELPCFPNALHLVIGSVEDKGVDVIMRIRYSAHWPGFPMSEAAVHQVARRPIFLSTVLAHTAFDARLDIVHGLTKRVLDHGFNGLVVAERQIQRNGLRNRAAKVVSRSAIFFAALG